MGLIMEGKLAFIFPGQGAQYVGMGKDIHEHFNCSKRIFDIASNITEIDLVELCFQGPKEDLADTLLCQVAIFTVSIATLKALLYYVKEQNIDISPVATAGLSLGEYTALVYAGVLTFEDGVRLVYKRGQYMKEAAEEAEGSMISILGLRKEEVDKVCESTGVEIANLNCPGQIVISGDYKKIKKAVQLAKKYKAKRVIPLKVAGAYHSRLMKLAENKLKDYIKNIKFSPPKTLFISNITGDYCIKPEEIKKNLIEQVSSSVYWQKSMGLMLDTGIISFLKIGPGKVLSGLLRRIDNSLRIYNIETKTDIENSLRDLEI